MPGYWARLPHTGWQRISLTRMTSLRCLPFKLMNTLFQQQTTQVNFEERQQTFHEITNYMFENVIWLGLWQDPDVWAVSGDLANVTMSGVTPFFSIAQWDISQ